MAAVVVARWRSHGISGNGVKVSTLGGGLGGARDPLGCGSDQIGGGVDGVEGLRVWLQSRLKMNMRER